MFRLLLLAVLCLLPTLVDAAVRVRGYYRKDGTYVRPHYRSNPDGVFSNNWSTYGNVNPYTGKEGWIKSPPKGYGGDSSVVSKPTPPSKTTSTTSGTKSINSQLEPTLNGTAPQKDDFFNVNGTVAVEDDDPANESPAEPEFVDRVPRSKPLSDEQREELGHRISTHHRQTQERQELRQELEELERRHNYVRPKYPWRH